MREVFAEISAVPPISDKLSIIVKKYNSTNWEIRGNITIIVKVLLVLIPICTSGKDFDILAQIL